MGTYFWLVEMSEASTGGVLWKKMFLKISQNSQGITCAKVSFLINLQVSGNFFTKQLRTAASEIWALEKRIERNRLSLL